MKMVMGICITLLTAVNLEAQTTARAEITFSQLHIDLKDFCWKPDGSGGSYRVTLKNTGSVPVQFTRCQCPCGCYVIGAYPKQLLNPGDTGSVMLHHYPRPGMNDRYTYLWTNIPDDRDESGFLRYAFRVTGTMAE